MTDSNTVPDEPASVEPAAPGTPEATAGPGGPVPGTNQPHGTRTLSVLVALVVVLLLAAGAFGTLWFIERGDHRATTDQLTAARAETDDANAKRQKAEARERDADNTSMRKASEREKAEDKITQAYIAISWMSKGSTPCAQAGRKFAQVLSSGTSMEIDKAVFDIGDACGV